MRIGYHLSSEELDPISMVRCAARAEQVGFDFITVSDHYHPWTHRQGQSPFVWAVLGGIAAVTSRVDVGTAGTRPTLRIPPAGIAQAAAPAAGVMPGGFFFRGGPGGGVDEHTPGDPGPPGGGPPGKRG